MFSFSGSSSADLIKTRTPTVLATNMTLSERFEKVPSHNPLRPNDKFKNMVNKNLLAAKKKSVERILRDPSEAEHVGFGTPKLNKLAVVRASKDAEILRLREELRNTRLQLNSTKRVSGQDALKGVLRAPMKNRGTVLSNRGGGGFVVKHKGSQLNLQNKAALKFLLGKSNVGSGLGRASPSPLKRKGKKGENFFGSPKSKEDLDNELDAYMSKSKSKQKTSLDDELEAYMSARRSQALTGAGNPKSAQADTESATNAIVTPAESEGREGEVTPIPSVTESDDEDNAMQIVE